MVAALRQAMTAQSLPRCATISSKPRRRWRSSSSTRRTRGMRQSAEKAYLNLLVADVDDLVALEAAGGLDLDDLAGFLADERFADGGAVGDAVRLDVGLVLADDLPGR